MNKHLVIHLDQLTTILTSIFSYELIYAVTYDNTLPCNHMRVNGRNTIPCMFAKYIVKCAPRAGLIKYAPSVLVLKILDE
jgi:hypothetical protein